jgi:hypothetical protein
LGWLKNRNLVLVFRTRPQITMSIYKRPRIQRMARRRRQKRAQARALAWLLRNPEARMWEVATAIKAELLAAGRLAETQAVIRNPAQVVLYL